MKHLTASWSRLAALTPEQRRIIEQVRQDAVAQGEVNAAGGPSCGATTEWIAVENPEFEQIWGAFRTDSFPPYKQPEHVWLRLSDGTIVDPTADQFGYEPIRVLRPGQPGYDDYLAGVDGDDLR